MWNYFRVSAGGSSPFKGEGGRGMGCMDKLLSRYTNPIPTPAHPMKGREKCPGVLKLVPNHLEGEECSAGTLSENGSKAYSTNGVCT